MVSPGQIYAAVVIGLLLAAVGVCLPVLGGIFRDGLERHLGESERDGAIDRTPTDGPDGAAVERSTCSECGAENDSTFTYCRRCAEPL